MSAKKAKFDTLRSLAWTGISGVYAAVGGATTINPRIICITNDTDAPMIFSDDNTSVTGKLYLAEGSFKLFDLHTNAFSKKDDALEIAEGVIWYVKQVSAPSTGSVYIEYVYG